MDQCETFGTESECTMLTNDDDEPRCYFGPLCEYENFETLSPTTTTATELTHSHTHSHSLSAPASNG